MRISEAWLRELVNPPVDTDQLVSQLTMAGLEVDSVEPVAADFNKVVVAQVMSLQSHPNADKLRVCQVDVGETEWLQIVCGADNVREGLKVPAALNGAVLPGDFKIKKSKLRGELSMGMLCSEKELGLSDEASGLMELSESAPVGMNIRQYLALEDSAIEVDLTPNRADCLSVEGIAREVAVLNQIDWTPLQISKIDLTHQDVLDVKVEAPEDCPRYLGRMIKNVHPQAETPVWMREKLRRSGVRSLGPLIDVTNYVLLELGQPLHAFDAAKLDGPVVVRKSRQDEELELLNEQTIKLDGETLVIADQHQALAFAGVMGGSGSAVSNETRDIFLECAYFNPVSIAGKARDYGLHTDSSHRFERGVDFTLQERAIERATQLILEISGGNAGPITEVTDADYLPPRNAVKLRRQRIEKMLGIRIDDKQVMATFQGLGMEVASVDDGWEITPPGYRFDIAIEADLIEELARIYGYNNLPKRSLLLRSELGKSPEALLPQDRIKDLLVDRGYQEAITYSFVDDNIQQAIAPEEEAIRLQNPISSDLSVMRSTLWCGLLNAALYNVKRQQIRLRLFESGLRFVKKNSETLQQPMLAGLALGSVLVEQWGEKTRKVDFFDIKADLEALFSMTGQQVTYQTDTHPALHPGQTARLLNEQSEIIGWLGMLHPTLEKQLGFESQVFLFELDLTKIQHKKIPIFKPLSKFPSVRRDMAVIVDEAVKVADIIGLINGCNEPSIQEVRIFDIYRGSGVEEGCKSVALSLMLQDFSQTLTDQQIDAIFSNVLQTLTTQLSAKLRD